jgi:hypothetical protein
MDGSGTSVATGGMDGAVVLGNKDGVSSSGILCPGKQLAQHNNRKRFHIEVTDNRTF